MRWLPVGRRTDDPDARRLARPSTHRVPAAATGPRFRRWLLVLERGWLGGHLRRRRRQPVAATGADRRCAAADATRSRSAASRRRRRPPTAAASCTSSTRPRCGRHGSTTDRAERLDDGSADFFFDPCATPDGSERRVAGVERARHAVGRVACPARDLRSSTASTSSDRTRRFSRFGSCRTVRRCASATISGWLNLWLGDAPLVDEPFEHGGPTWGMGQRSFAVSPDGTQSRSPATRRGFGRLCVVDVATRQRARGRPWRARPALVAGRPARRVAIRRAHADPGRGLRHGDVGARRSSRSDR